MPFYYAALFGFSTVTRLLLDQGAEVNAQGGDYGNALQVVKMLLNAGAH
jgi:ankyrin repeat protein